MRDHPDLPAEALQAVEAGDGDVQGVRIEGAEALVDKQRFDLGALGGQRRQAEGEGERNEEALAAGEAVHRPHFVPHVAVDHLQFEVAAGNALKIITARQIFKVPVGVRQQRIEGEALGEGAKLVAIGRTDKLAQTLPHLPPLPLALPLHLHLAGLLAPPIIGQQFGLSRRPALPRRLDLANALRQLRGGGVGIELRRIQGAVPRRLRLPLLAQHLRLLPRRVQGFQGPPFFGAPVCGLCQQSAQFVFFPAGGLQGGAQSGASGHPLLLAARQFVAPVIFALDGGRQTALQHLQMLPRRLLPLAGTALGGL